MTPELHLGAYQHVLSHVAGVDLLCVDGPYSARCHAGHDSAVNMVNGGSWPRTNGRTDPRRTRTALHYEYWDEGDVDELVDFWAPRCRGWMVCLSDSDLCAAYRAAFERSGLTGFQPIPCVMPGMTVRLCGDGPSSWTVYASVARPKALSRWGTLPGAYVGKPSSRSEDDVSMIGGKPCWLMRALIRDYSKPGDLVCDPCAGAATTLLAAAIEGRRAIGAEVDSASWRKGADRLAAGYTPSLFTGLESREPDIQAAFDFTDAVP